MHLYYADTIALDLFGRLKPLCDRIKVAGSVRRRCEEVKDIELVLIPKTERRIEKDLFGGELDKGTMISPEFVKEIKGLGKVMKGKPDGRYMQIELTHQVEGKDQKTNIDLFMPQAEDYFRQLAIRTGSAEYAKTKIAYAWRKKGWVGTPEGLRLEKECQQVAEKTWKLRPDVYTPTLPPVWQSEEEFFRWLGVQYLKPFERNR